MPPPEVEETVLSQWGRVPIHAMRLQSLHTLYTVYIQRAVQTVRPNEPNVWLFQGLKSQTIIIYKLYYIVIKQKSV